MKSWIQVYCEGVGDVRVLNGAGVCGQSVIFADGSPVVISNRPLIGASGCLQRLLDVGFCCTLTSL
jgi:hypothetical protein